MKSATDGGLRGAAPEQCSFAREVHFSGASGRDSEVLIIVTD